MVVPFALAVVKSAACRLRGGVTGPLKDLAMPLLEVVDCSTLVPYVGNCAVSMLAAAGSAGTDAGAGHS